MSALSNNQIFVFNEEQIQKKVQQLRQKFFKGHEKNQLKHKKGIVFIGNSRIGKSTLSALLGGIKMRKKMGKGAVVIEPLEQKHREEKNLIQHSFTSVTSYPNIHEMQIDGKFYTLVDLPGFKDTSYQKELCNQSYIKGLLQQLDQVLFVMVVKVHSENLTLSEDELGMMERFIAAFPTVSTLQPKQNLCMIINFVENIDSPQKQDVMKINIIEKIQKQLEDKDKEKNKNKNNMKSFYSKSVESNKVFLIERARNDNIENNEEYTIPKLLPFIRSNINRFSQNKEKSKYKIDLTRCQERKDKQLREVIWNCVQKMIEQIGERIEIYKRMLSSVLGLLSQAEGSMFGKQIYSELEDYYYKHNLSKFNGIQLPNQLQNADKQKDESNEGTIQGVIIKIGRHFGEMIKNNQFDDLKEELSNILKMSMKFFKILSKLFEKVFNYESSNELSKITENVKKSIYVNYLDSICLVENVETFTIHCEDMDDTSSLERYKEVAFNTYNNQIIRYTTFKDNLIKYFSAIINKSDSQHVDKINIEILKRIRQLCQVVVLKEIELKIPLSIYKSCHRKLKDKIYINNPQILHSTIAEINDLQMKDNQLKQINNWKKKEQDWQIIKGKNYIFFLDFLTKTGYKNKNELLQYYLNIKQFDEAINLLKCIIEDVESDTFNRLTAHEQCLKAKQKMLEAWYLPGALKCCKFAEKLYLYEDKTKVFKANQDYLNILKKFMIQDPTTIIDEMDEYSYKLKNSPWTEILDSDYDSILKTVYQHIQNFLLKENGISSNKSPYVKKSPQERGSIEFAKHIYADQPQESPIRVRQILNFEQPQKMGKKQQMVEMKKVEQTPPQRKKALFKKFNSK